MISDTNNLASNTQDLNDYLDVLNSDDDTTDHPLQLLNIKSNYYHIEDIQASIPQDASFKYKSIHINTQSLPDKHDKLKLLLLRLKEANVIIDFILLCETFLNDKNADLYQIPGYTFIHKVVLY